MTGQWEAYLQRIQRGDGATGAVPEGHRGVRARGGGQGRGRRRRPPKTASRPAGAAAAIPRRSMRPHRSEPAATPYATGRHALRICCTAPSAFPSFRANQEAVCRAVIEGRDVLLVMPTGAGKSLCYQLPGIARGGTTLVISPLIALMEDQVAKLQAARLRRGAHPFRPRPRRLAPGLHRLPQRQAAVPLHRARAAARRRLSRRCSRSASPR